MQILFFFCSSRASGNLVVLHKSYQKDAPLAVIRGQFYNPRTFVCPSSCCFLPLLHAVSPRPVHFSIRIFHLAIDSLLSRSNCYALYIYFFASIFRPQKRSNVFLIAFFSVLCSFAIIVVNRGYTIWCDNYIISLRLYRNLLINDAITGKFNSSPLFLLFYIARKISLQPSFHTFSALQLFILLLLPL